MAQPVPPRHAKPESRAQKPAPFGLPVSSTWLFIGLMLVASVVLYLVAIMAADQGVTVLVAIPLFFALWPFFTDGGR